MKLITVALISLVALTAVMGLIYVRTGTGQAYYNSYSYLSVNFVGSVNIQNGVIDAFGDGVPLGSGQVVNGKYQVMLPGWRDHLVMSFRVNGHPCGKVPVAAILTSQQRTYNGDTLLDLQCM